MGSQRLTKDRLSQLRQELVTRMQRLGFGRIERLAVRGGQPVIESARFLRDVKLGRRASAQEVPASDFELKFALVDLFEQLEDLGDGEIDFIEIRHGLPNRIVVEQRPLESEVRVEAGG
jgi:hypothetical protein